MPPQLTGNTYIRFANRYVRKVHRWLVLPFVVVILAMILTINTPAGFAVQRAQQVLILAMALTGLCLSTIPWLVKWRKRERRMS
jgi:hypothetical protein